MTPSRLFAFLPFCLAVWATLLPVAAYAATQPAGSDTWHAFALGIYSFGSAICHQRAERSFHAFGAQLPVCARCTGIYVGAAIAAMMMSFVGSGFSRTSSVQQKLRLTASAKATAVRRSFTRRRKAEPTITRMLLALAALPAALTLIYEWTTGIVPSNAIRAATGLVLGAAVALVVQRAVRDQVN